MGQSTDAILFFGFCWTEETDRPWVIGKDTDDAHGSEEWYERYSRLRAVPRPNKPYPDKRGAPSCEPYSAEERAVVDEYEALWATNRRLTDEEPVEVGTHCSDACPMPFVAVKASKTTAWRGEPKNITSLEVDPTWVPALYAFCSLMGIDVGEQVPAWWLVSDWS